jgi:hypothetical protein
MFAAIKIGTGRVNLGGPYTLGPTVASGIGLQSIGATAKIGLESSGGGFAHLCQIN